MKTAENAVVIGGAKSAYDVAYAYADAGAKVDLVVRPDGQGPVWISHLYVDFGLRLEKLLHIRFLTCFSPVLGLTRLVTAASETGYMAQGLVDGWWTSSGQR